MQTFLPAAQYSKSAALLDNKRLGKQRVECKQILLALGLAVGTHPPGKKGWQNHPAVRMWRGYEAALALYSFCMCQEWLRRGFKDTLTPEFVDLYERLMPDAQSPPQPPWLGRKKLHASHRSNLLRKDPIFYGKFGWAEPDDLPYFWPV